MNKSFYGIFPISIILACWTLTNAKPFDKVDENNPNASLSCILFENFGCNMECAILYKLYQYESTGTCNAHKACICAVEPRPAGVKSFTASKKKNSHLRKYVETQLDERLEGDERVQDIESRLRVNYVGNLIKYLDENRSKAGIQKVFHQIRLCPNTELNTFLDWYVVEHGLNEKRFKSKDDKSTWQITISHVDNQLIKRIGAVMCPIEDEPEESEGDAVPKS